ncbi:MAG TPA: ArsR family transcriptional regulator [Gemmatimonadota bacterium]|jgi:predicted ArsR family transcriptional regulator
MIEETLPEGTKRTLLDLLVRRERTAEELAGLLDVSATAVRQHLSTLSGLGLVERRKGDTRGGRPAFLYRLSEIGRRAYPKRHDLFARELISTLIAREGPEWTLAVVTDTARHLADEVRGEIVVADRDRRLEALAGWLESKFAWEADVEEDPGGGTRFVVHQCPFQAVSADHPAVCGAFFTTLLEQLTDAGPYVHRPIGDGVCCCALETLPAIDG